jgi:hypothetical protein
MKRIHNGIVGIDQGTVTLFSDFESDGEMWTGTGPREKRVSVKFGAEFRSAPAVHVSLAMIDADRRHNQRLDLSAEGVGRKGFQIVVKTWGDTKIARARASWLAVGELPDPDDWNVT